MSAHRGFDEVMIVNPYDPRLGLSLRLGLRRDGLLLWSYGRRVCRHKARRARPHRATHVNPPRTESRVG